MMPNKYEGSGELAAVIAERDALRAEVKRLQKTQKQQNLLFNSISEDYRRQLAKAHEALQGMLSRWGLCREVTAGGPWQVITGPMADHRCGKCESCRARQTLKEITDEQAE